MVGEADFFVRFWGVRGSIPCPGPATARYGGNTACLEVRCGRRLLILDAGTGLYEFGLALAKAGPIDADLLLTHSHYDHVWGWPHFQPALDPKSVLRIHAGHLANSENSIEDLMRGLIEDPMNPVNERTLKARLSFHTFSIGESLPFEAPLCIRTAPLVHPNRAAGYRIEFAGRSICYITDTEHNPKALDENVLHLIADADLMIYDCTYTDQEFPSHVGWGHSTWQEGVRLSARARVKTFVVFHHDPDHDDVFMDQIAEQVAALRPGSVVAREGLILRP